MTRVTGSNYSDSLCFRVDLQLLAAWPLSGEDVAWSPELDLQMWGEQRYGTGSRLNDLPKGKSSWFRTHDRFSSQSLTGDATSDK